MSDDVKLPGGVRYHPNTLKRLERQRDEAIEQRDYWKKQLLTEQADYDKARAENVRLDRMLVHAWAERDALKEALIHASQRLGDLGAHVPDEFSRRRIAEITSDISQALTGLEEA